MSGQAKLPVLIAVILLSLSLASGSFYFMQKERIKNTALQQELDDVKARQKIAETKLEESKKTVSDLEAKLEESKTQIDALSGQLSQEASAKQEIVAQVEQLKTELEQQKASRADLDKKLAKAEEDSAKFQEQLKALHSEKASLEARLKDIEAAQAQEAKVEDQSQGQGDDGVQLGTIVVNPEAVVSTTPAEEKITAVSGLEGKVLVINKDYNFAVINLGSKDGISVGDIFSAYHNNKYVGDIKVEKVHDSMSAMGFASVDIKDKINEGDRVVKKD